MKRHLRTLVLLMVGLGVGGLIIAVRSIAPPPSGQQNPSAAAHQAAASPTLLVDETPIVSPTLVPEIPPFAIPITPTQLTTTPVTSGLTLIVSELQPTTITVWAISVDDPAQREPLLILERPGQGGIHASLSHDGTRIAYARRPPDSNGSNRFIAELWVADLANPQPRKLATQVDIGRYRDYPIWSADDRWIAFERQSSRNIPYERSISVIDVLTGRETTLVTTTISTDAEAYRVHIALLNWSPNARTLYYQVGFSNHVELWQIDPIQRSSTKVGVITENGVPRCYTLSPDGQYLLCTILEQDPSKNAIRLIPTSTGQTQTLATGFPHNLADPIWAVDGKNITVNWNPDIPEQSIVSLIDVITLQNVSIASPLEGFWGPLSWSPDGQWVGIGQETPDSSSLVLLNRDGLQTKLIGTGGWAIVGWTMQDFQGR
jgi:Tol biopolymer transport system component